MSKKNKVHIRRNHLGSGGFTPPVVRPELQPVRDRQGEVIYNPRDYHDQYGVPYPEPQQEPWYPNYPQEDYNNGG